MGKITSSYVVGNKQWDMKRGNRWIATQFRTPWSISHTNATPDILAGFSAPKGFQLIIIGLTPKFEAANRSEAETFVVAVVCAK